MSAAAGRGTRGTFPARWTHPGRWLTLIAILLLALPFLARCMG